MRAMLFIAAVIVSPEIVLSRANWTPKSEFALARLGRASLFVVALSIIAIFTGPPAMGQAQHLTVTIVTEKLSATVTDAEISVDVGSDMHYIGGGYARNWVAQSGLLVTDPVVPPQGFKLQPTRLNWAAVKQVEFLAACRPNEQQSQPPPEKLTMSSGESKNVYLWYDRRGDLTSLSPTDLKITGKMSVAGQLRGIEFQADVCQPLRLTIQLTPNRGQ